MGDPGYASNAEQEIATRHEIDWLLRHYGGEAFALPKQEDRRAPAPKRPAAKAPAKPAPKSSGGGHGKKGFDPNQPRAKDGKWNPGGGGGGGAKKDEKAKPRAKKAAPPKKSKQARVKALVEGILDSLDDVMRDLTGPQAQALIKKIKSNAKAFIDGQDSAPHHGGAKKGHGGKEPDSTKVGAKDAKGGGAKGGKEPDSKKAPAKKHHGAGGVAGIVASVQSLLNQFGKQMKPRDRAKLQRAVDGLKKAAAEVTTFASEGSDVSKSVCIMAIPAEDDPVHGIGPEEKHATVLYFGDWDTHGDPERMQASKDLLANVLSLAAQDTQPFTATVTGVEALGSEEPPAQVWLLDSPDLQALFGGIPEIDSEVNSLYEDADATRYPNYKAHVTIGYFDPEDDGDLAAEAEAVKEIAFDRISLWWGNERIDFPLGSGVDDAELAALLAYFGIND